MQLESQDKLPPMERISVLLLKKQVQLLASIPDGDISNDELTGQSTFERKIKIQKQMLQRSNTIASNLDTSSDPGVIRNNSLRMLARRAMKATNMSPTQELETSKGCRFYC